MADFAGFSNINEYYTKYYLANMLEKKVDDYAAEIEDSMESSKLPWNAIHDLGHKYGEWQEEWQHTENLDAHREIIAEMTDGFLAACGYPEAKPVTITVAEAELQLHMACYKGKNQPAIYVLTVDTMDNTEASDGEVTLLDEIRLTAGGKNLTVEDVATHIFFDADNAPRWLIVVGLREIVLLDRTKWGKKKYLSFDLPEIFSRHDVATYKAIAMFLSLTSLCPEEGEIRLDKLDEDSHRHAQEVSGRLKFALRQCIELLGNEVYRDKRERLHEGVFSESPEQANWLTLQCLRWMYRLLFVFFIEAKPELGFAPMKSATYAQGYSLEHLRDIVDNVHGDFENVQYADGYFIQDSLNELFELIYHGFEMHGSSGNALTDGGNLFSGTEFKQSVSHIFSVEPLKAHIFDRDMTPDIQKARLRNCVLLQILDKMSNASDGKSRKRISYANLGINQMGAVYEALMSYRGFFAQTELYEVQPKTKKGDENNSLDIGYFVTKEELLNYDESEIVYEGEGLDRHKKHYDKGQFIYRLAGRERENSASYYTPAVLTSCLVKYALKELLKDKTADEILQLKVCEPAMGSAAFLNECVDQLSEAYLSRKQKELHETIPAKERAQKLQQVKMYIADQNIYGVDLNPIARELAEVSIWLNTIYQGSYVPWFGTQLICGNSLIGARRQVYKLAQLKEKSKKKQWYNYAPERVKPGDKRPQGAVYHFLLGDEGMAAYKDKVIKQMLPEGLEAIKKWKKGFLAPITGDEAENMEHLSETIDELWGQQVELRKKLENETSDNLTIYGQPEKPSRTHTTVREKDKILKKLYYSEEMANAGPYARLKFAMDYWCALWFWPVEKADMLPSRREYLEEMNWILVGNIIDTSPEQNLFGDETAEEKQMRLFNTLKPVNLDMLCAIYPRLQLVKEIANRQHFLHWELEFADVFAERGGFDLMVGNPPWIKLEWKEQNVLSDKQPLFAIRNFSATEIMQKRKESLQDKATRDLYFDAYENVSGTKNFLNAMQNYPDLMGQQADLYKCFLPQSWQFICKSGVSAFVHPNEVFGDSKGGRLRSVMYTRLRNNFRFVNEANLFTDVDAHTGFGLNIYGAQEAPHFDMICQLYIPSTIDSSYYGNERKPLPLSRNENGKNFNGHPDRVISIRQEELQLFAKTYGEGYRWTETVLPEIYCNQVLKVIRIFSIQDKTVGTLKDDVYTTECWHETMDQNKGFICAVKNGENIEASFPKDVSQAIYSAPNIGMLNPYASSTKRLYHANGDYDYVDLQDIPEKFLIRCKYRPGVDKENYVKALPNSPWGKATDSYRIFNREFVRSDMERTLTCAIAPRAIAHVNAIFSVTIKNCMDLSCLAGCEASIPYDFFVKTLGKRHINYKTCMLLPIFEAEKNLPIILRTLLLNCLSVYYKDLWRDCWRNAYNSDGWAKDDHRLSQKTFSQLSQDWTWHTPLRTDYARHQAFLELDVLVAQELGMTLEQLKDIYLIQFPIMRKYERETYYDDKGRIVFSPRRSLKDLCYTREEFATIIDAPAGQKFYRTIIDDTQPGGPRERIIEYVAPFDRCDREQDYETAWAYFEGVKQHG